MPDMSPSDPAPPTFAPPAPERSNTRRIAVVGAAVAILLALAVIFFGSSSHHGVPVGAVLPLDAHAASLPLSDLAMSESTSLSGGKSTFIDGHVHNGGTQTVTGVTVQVLFRNDVGLAPQVETLPLQLIRTHEPYIDTQPISAAPLAAGDTREFRLTFETINSNWNIQLPEIHIVRVTTK